MQTEIILVLIAQIANIIIAVFHMLRSSKCSSSHEETLTDSGTVVKKRRKQINLSEEST